ncbi:MAG: biotin/lipoyl-containing protein, partial [Parvibaculum sp.]
EQMIRVAAGEKLAIMQSDVRIKGWAIESRIYAEDPYRNFLPSTGRLVRYRPPAEGTAGGLTVRNDTGVYEGGEISMFYDPMIAKLCTHGPDRLAAIEHMAGALDEFHIEGIQHNIPFVNAIMEHPRFRSGNITTGFIAEEYPEGFHGVALADERAVRFAAIAVYINSVHAARAVQISGQLAGRPRKLPTEWVASVGDWTQRVTAEDANGALRVIFLDAEGARGASHLVRSQWVPGQAVFRGEVDGISMTVEIVRAKQGYVLRYRGASAHAVVRTATGHRLNALMPEKVAADTSKLLLCPMPGLVKAIHVEVGQEVKAGEALAVVEAMKMENILRAESDGTVEKINAAPGDSLAVDAVIMEFA